jgi:hypothetical protein
MGSQCSFSLIEMPLVGILEVSLDPDGECQPNRTFGRPARLVWSKRRWRCRDVECPVKTWTERSVHVPPRALLTRRAGIEARRQVGELALEIDRLEQLNQGDI